jgi:hypothetical protein
MKAVLDFGLHPDELARLRDMIPTTAAAIAALIVDEAELAARGRWGGQPQPPRWRPSWGVRRRSAASSPSTSGSRGGSSSPPPPSRVLDFGTPPGEPARDAAPEPLTGRTRPRWVYIENEGALFRGASQAWPSEIYQASRGGGTWQPYTGRVPKPIEWGDIITQAAAEKMMAEEDAER